jgi:Skp family chaperone for outer membrane proteins
MLPERPLRRRFVLGLAGIAMVLCLMAGQPRNALAELPASVVAVVDVQFILQEAAASKNIQKQLEVQRETYQNEISKQEDRLRAVEQELNRQRSVLSPDKFAQKRREFEQQVADVQRTVQARKRVLDQAFNESMTKVRDTVLQMVTEVAGEQKATLVLAKQQVVLAEKSLDLTSAVLERVNRKLPTVPVTVPKS